MVPLGPEAIGWLPMRDDAPHRMVALRHGATHERPGLWGDDPARPSSVIWLREGDGGHREAFAAGLPGPSIDWLAGRAGHRPIALMAPPSWEEPIRSRAEHFDRATVRTWLRPGSGAIAIGPIPTRRLGPGDSPAFERIAPPWALRSWGGYASMIARGAAFGVEGPGGLASIAWTYESDDRFDKIGVATAPATRRLGLGRAAASALVDHVVRARAKQPLWTTHDGNSASVALARSIGFTTRVAETLLRWTPRGTVVEGH